MSPVDVVDRSGDLGSHHRNALASTRSFVAAITADQWTNHTPCSEWDLRELVNHVVVGNLWAAELAAGRTIGAVGDRLDGDHLGADPLRAYDDSAEAAASAFEADGALDAPCAVSYGPVPGSVYVGHRLVDVFVHGWDIAVASGQDPTLDAALTHACWDVIEPQLEGLQASGMFGTKPADPSPTDPQSRLLVALGRSLPTSRS